MIDEILQYNKAFVEKKGYETYITSKYPNKKIAIDITSGNQFNVAVIELNIDTAIKLSKELRRQIAILKNIFSILSSLSLSVFNGSRPPHPTNWR